MPKRKKVLLIILIAMLILSITAGIIVYAITINGKTFNSYGGNYYTAYNQYRWSSFRIWSE